MIHIPDEVLNAQSCIRLWYVIIDIIQEKLKYL